MISDFKSIGALFAHQFRMSCNVLTYEEKSRRDMGRAKDVDDGWGPPGIRAVIEGK
jgi:hypothetical protein